MANQDKRPGIESQAGRYVISALISAGALGLGFAHIAFPDVKIDNYTIVLFVIGIAPWLAPLFKSIELPGGWKFEFKEFQRQVQEDLKRKDEKVEELKTRVERVEQFAFSGALDQTEKDSLNTALVSYHDYLKGLGFDLSGEAPSVFVDADLKDNAYYDGEHRKIVIGKPFADDLDVLFREYTHHVLTTDAGADVGVNTEEGEAIESGIADYLPCSFNNDPKLAEKMATIFQREGKLQKPYVRNLENARTFTEVGPGMSSQDSGEIWGGAFWDMRGSLGKEVADGAVAAAWLASRDAMSAKGAGSSYVQQLMAAVEPRTGKAGTEKVLAIFERRKLKVRPPTRRRGSS